MGNLKTEEAGRPRQLTVSSSMSSCSADNVLYAAGLPEYLNLSDQVVNRLKRQISAAVENVLESMMDERTEDKHWQAKMQKDGIVYYEDKVSVTKQQTRFCCVSSTDASVQDCISLFVVSDTDMLLQRCRIMYDNIMDARILKVLDSPSQERPWRSSYIRYTAFKARRLQRNNRDMCVVVATDVMEYPDGSTVGYCVPPQGFIRTRMFRSGYFVQHSGLPNTPTKIAYIVGIEAGGLAPRFTTRYYMPRFGQVLGRILRHLRGRQLDPTTFVDQSQWADKQAAEFCQCCSKHFGAVKLLDTRRYNCVSCGDAICHACHHLEQVDIPGGTKVKVGICVGCNLDNKSKRASRSFPTDRSMSSMSA
ncbi:hypothetical protein PsorP6_019443 [Peronosclerospora sorghi]|nr:hypothetical protein PsorP6_019443 [Peronosclerospora sorghi]